MRLRVPQPARHIQSRSHIHYESAAALHARARGLLGSVLHVLHQGAFDRLQGQLGHRLSRLHASPQSLLCKFLFQTARFIFCLFKLNVGHLEIKL